MPLTTYRVTRRDGADRGEFALAALDLCRQYRGFEGVIDARYWWSGSSRLAIVIETEPGVVAQQLGSPELANAVFAMDELGDSHGIETWNDARGAAEAWESAGRPSGS
jgi:hypothetical protein